MAIAPKPRIMAVGSSNTDMVIKSNRIPSPGETILGGEFRMVAGGKGANQAVASARLGAEVVFAAKLGNDVFGEQALENFRDEGIDTSCITIDETKPSGVALILVDAKGENSIAVAPGANMSLSPEDIENSRRKMAECSVLALQLEIPMETVEYSVNLAKELGLKVILNPAPMHPKGLSDTLLRNVDILVPNEREASMLLGLEVGVEFDPLKVRELLDLGVGNVVVTLGEKGALIVTHEGSEMIEVRKVEAVDTTAAGDAFVGALAYGISSGWDLRKAVEFGNAAASISVTRMGAQSSLPKIREIPWRER